MSLFLYALCLHVRMCWVCVDVHGCVSVSMYKHHLHRRTACHVVGVSRVQLCALALFRLRTTPLQVTTDCSIPHTSCSGPTLHTGNITGVYSRSSHTNYCFNQQTIVVRTCMCVCVCVYLRMCVRHAFELLKGELHR